MEAVLQYDIPVLHPLAVHFSLALLVAAVLPGLVWAIGGRDFWRRATLLLMSLGAAGTVFAYLTGEPMEEQSEGVPIVEELIETHETAALYTLIVALAGLVVLGGLSFALERRITIERDAPDPLWSRVVGFVLVLAAAVLVAWTAHVGGTMVWGV